MAINTKPESLKQSGKSASEYGCTRILVTGANGYLGSNLRIFLNGAGYDIYGVTSKETTEEKIYRLNMNDYGEILRILGSVKPDVVVHTAALSSLSECEKNPELAMKVNVQTRNLIDAILKTDQNAKFVFLSSDYVFDGQRGNYSEEDDINPQTVYGKTKALSETDIKARMENFLICRTANVYGRGGKFFNFVLGALEQNRPIDVFDDAFFTPTYIDYLLDSLKLLIAMDFKGIIHLAGRQRLSRYDFALKMAETLGKDVALVRPVKVGQLVAKDNSLNCDYSRKVLPNCWPNVETSLHYCFGNLVPPYFHHADQRGQIIGIFQGLRWEEINYIESTKGGSRGNHFHKNTTEGIFVIDGKIRVTLVDLLENSKRTFIAEKGATLIINPNVLHTFEMIEDSKWINMLSKPFDKVKDIHTC